MRKVVAFLCFYVFSPYLLAAAEVNPEVLELYRLSGIQKQIEQYSDMTKAALSSGNQPATMNAEEIKEIGKLFDKVFAPQALQPVVVGFLQNNLDSSDIKKVLEWLRSPAGRRITQVEEARSSAQGYQDMMDYANGLASNPPPQDYLKKMQDLATNINLFESTVNISLNAQLALMTAVAAATSPEFNERQFNQLADQLQALKPAMAEKVSQMAMLGLLYTYNDMAAADLDPYIAFNATPAARNYNAAAVSALNEALIQASKQLGFELVKLREDLHGKQKS